MLNPPITSAHQLEICPLSDHEWRVCDGRADPNDPLRIVGYIVKCPDGFDVLTLGPAPVFRGVFPRWGAAIEEICGATIESSVSR